MGCQIINISIPSKTFLLGEYVALQGGPTLILTSPPYFRGQVSISDISIDPLSPAGKLIQSDPDFFNAHPIQWIDPYHGLGGFGASTAQFLMLYALQHKPPIDSQQLLASYLKHAWDGEGTAPSGADLIAQLLGGITFFYKKTGQLQTYAWLFPELEYALLHTGNKLATHTHLKELAVINYSELEKIALQGIHHFINQNAEAWIASVNEYASALNAQQLVCDNTLALLEKLAKNPDILAKKGCGALGADVIFILFKKENRMQIAEWLKINNFNLIAIGNEVAEGFHVMPARF